MARRESRARGPGRGALALGAAVALLPLASPACSSDDTAPGLLGDPLGGAGRALGGGARDASLADADAGAQGPEATSDGSAGDSADGGDGSVCAAKASILVDFNSSPCGRCFVAQCATLVDACLDDCTCGTGLQTAFDCFRLGGAEFTCDATASGHVPETDQTALLTCQETCAATCLKDGGAALDAASP